MINGWTDPKQCRRTLFNGNYGVITGEANNILVVDLDNKNEGFEEFQKYIDAHGLPNTYTVSTSGGGLHLYFNSKNEDENDSYLIENHLPSASGYRGKGIDIKNKGGGVVGPGSIRNDIPYAVINNSPIIDIPSNLIIWLLENRKLSQHKRTGEYTDNSAYNYIVEDDILKKY